MKYIFTLLLTAGMATIFAQDEIKLQTDEEKYAYYSLFLLVDFHKDYQKPTEEELMLQAVQDALNDKPSKVAKEDVDVLFRRLREKWIRQKKWDYRKTIPTDPEKWTDEEKSAYDSAYSYIIRIKNNEWFDKDIILQSAKDAFGGKVNRLENDPFAWVRRRLDVKQAVAHDFSGNSYAKKNWEAGVAYQKANKEKKGVKVTASGLQYRVIKEGTGEKPTLKDTVSITYKTTLIDGKVLDDSKKLKEVKLTELLQGIAEGLQLMKVGAKYELVVPPELGWAMGARPPPKCSTVIVEVELVDIVEKNQ